MVHVFLSPLLLFCLLLLLLFFSMLISHIFTCILFPFSVFFFLFALFVVLPGILSRCASSSFDGELRTWLWLWSSL